MYVPAPFTETDSARLYDFIEENSFGLLVSAKDRLAGTHLPILLERNSDGRAALVGHFAKANIQWQAAADQPVLVVFSGPHAYISPSWYETEKLVPTWNYISVHVSGRLQLVEEESRVLEILSQFVEHYEQAMPTPWQLDASTPHTRKLAELIVAFRIEIEHIEGAWKLSQNHPRERREKVIRGLRQRGDGDSQRIAQWMQEQIQAEEDHKDA